VNTTISGIIAILQLFFSKNPTVEEVLPIIEQAGTALANAKAGVAFSISFPEAIDGKAGTSTFGWAPTTSA
jgi:hypothetical protein